MGDADVAYQAVGDGPFDLLYFLGLGSQVDIFWDMPDVAEFLKRLAAFSRLLFFDRRGTGASDAVPRSAFPTWEEWTEDVGAVLDAVGSKQVAILASLDSGPIAMLYAALHPERVNALILLNTSARYLAADDYPIGESAEAVEAFVTLLGAMWGTPDLVRLINPAMADDAEYLRIGAKQLRAAATPRTAAAQYRYILRSLDVRQALPLIQAPTLVLHVPGNPMVPIAHGRFLADHIDGARFVELRGGDIGISSESYTVVDEVAEFLTGERSTVDVERVLTTVLFTDIVGSTERAASVGDRRWRSLLDAHDRIVREQLRRFRGTEINTTGDGFVASFDGPARAIRCAQAMLDATSSVGIDLRIGMHTGECEVRGDDLAGLTVHIAARVGALARPREVLVSSTIKDLVVGSELAFDDRGEHELKGVPGNWRLFAAVP